MSKKKLIYTILFFLTVLSCTFYVVFTKIDINTLIEDLQNIDIRWMVLCVVLVGLYFIFQGLYMKLTLKSMNEKVSLIKTIYYSMVEFFFSGITPSSTGGQPAQLYFMKKDNISTSKSLVTLLLNTIYFKIYMVVMGIIIAIFNYKFIFTSQTFNIMFILGMIVDILIIVGAYLTMYHANIIRMILKIFYKIVNKIRKHKIVKSEDIEVKIASYKRQTDYISEHKKDVYIGLLLTFIQRTCLFSIAYVIYRALGFNSYTYYQLLVLQISAQIAIEGLPLPGGTGASEGILNRKFQVIFGPSLAGAGMLLTRFFSYYFVLILCMLVILVSIKTVYKSKSN